MCYYDYLYVFDLSTAYDISTATLNPSKGFSLSANTKGISISEDGTKMMTVEWNSYEREYTLSTPHDPSTATLAYTKYDGHAGMSGGAMSLLGCKLVINHQSQIEQYGLNSSYNLTSRTTDGTNSAPSSGDKDMVIKPDQAGSSLDPSGEHEAGKKTLTTKIGVDATIPTDVDKSKYEIVKYNKVDIDDYLR